MLNKLIVKIKPEYGTALFGVWLLTVNSPKLITAVVSASIALCRLKRSFWPIVQESGKLLRALRAVVVGPHPSQKVYKERMGHCPTCPLFNARRGTCGTAGRTFFNNNTKEYEALGCFCVMEVKAATLCNCWAANATGGQAGWPEELNSHPQASHQL